MTRISWENVVVDTLGWTWGIREYLAKFRHLLPDAQRREREALTEIADEFGWDSEAYALEMSEIQGKFDYWLPKVVAYSVITILHSVVETQLRALANRLRRLHNEKLKPKEISGDAIERSKIYLVKVIGLPITDDPAWQTLTDLASIRHIIVHDQGVIGDDTRRRKRVDTLKQRYPHDLSEHIGELLISLFLCEQFVDKVEEFFRRLFKESGLPQDVRIE